MELPCVVGVRCAGKAKQESQPAAALRSSKAVYPLPSDYSWDNEQDGQRIDFLVIYAAGKFPSGQRIDSTGVHLCWCAAGRAANRFTGR